MKLGEFETTRLLGRGAMSEVWEAVNARLGARYAVKVYSYANAKAAEEREARARFVQEGQMLAKLCHPHIVGVTDFGISTEGTPYFVMNLVLNPKGVPQALSDLGEGIDEEMVARWYEDLRDALAYIHAKGIIHRDLKLQNVMIGPDGHVVLVDFGISHLGDAADGHGTVADPVKTLLRMQHGQRPLMGSLGYMAPELEMGTVPTKASDWYALGVLIYRLLTGTWCDARTDLNETLETFNPAWQKILPKLLHQNPAGRSCPSFVATCAQLRERQEALAEETYAQERLRGHQARHAARWAWGLAAALAIVAIFEANEIRTSRSTWRVRLQMAGDHRQVPTFNELFPIPAEAGAEERSDAQGNVTMPSRGQFASARVDALVLTQPLFAALEDGRMAVEDVITKFESMAESLNDEADHSPLENLEFGGNIYMPMGENPALRYLMQAAAAKLRARVEE